MVASHILTLLLHLLESKPGSSPKARRNNPQGYQNASVCILPDLSKSTAACWAPTPGWRHSCKGVALPTVQWRELPCRLGMWIKLGVQPQTPPLPQATPVQQEGPEAWATKRWKETTQHVKWRTFSIRIINDKKSATSSPSSVPKGLKHNHQELFHAYSHQHYSQWPKVDTTQVPV